MKMISEKMFIYALINPMTDKIFYIGRSKDAHTRLLSHIHKSYLKKTAKDYILTDILAAGYSPKVKIIEEISVDLNDKKSIFNISEREKYWISFYSKELLLTKSYLSNHQHNGQTDLEIKSVEEFDGKTYGKCEYCDGDMFQLTKRRRFCSDKCRVYWNRDQKLKDELKEEAATRSNPFINAARGRDENGVNPDERMRAVQERIAEYGQELLSLGTGTFANQRAKFIRNKIKELQSSLQ